MLSVTLYQFKKRENSTKRPDSTVTQRTHSAVLKMPTSLLTPEITFDFGLKGNPSFYNYAYISDLGNRYYFIRDWTVSEGHIWTARMEVDVLASWKVSIGESTQYVIRSSAAFDGAIVDTLYPTKQGVTVKNSTTETPFKTKFEDGRYVLGIVNGDTAGVGANHYYVLTQAQMNALSAYLLGESNWLDISDISDNLTKALFNPFQYIVSCNWFPFAVGQKNILSALPFGWWNIPVSGAGDLASLIQRGTTYLDIPKHPQATRGKYLNGGPYTDLALYYPGFGTIALDANRLVDVTRLILVVQVDCVANTARLLVGYSNNSEIALDNIIGVYYSQVGITIPKIVSKSKKDLIIIRQYIDKENCLIDLSKNELEEKAIELLFNMYRFARLYKFDLDYHPDNYCYKDGKLYYLLNEMYKKDPKHSLEEEGLFYWINSSTLNNYLIDNNLPKLEHVLSKAEANKKVVLLGVKYW